VHPGLSEKLPILTLKDARKYMMEGHFPEGSMNPKVKAAMQFAGIPGKRAVIVFLEGVVNLKCWFLNFGSLE